MEEMPGALRMMQTRGTSRAPAPMAGERLPDRAYRENERQARSTAVLPSGTDIGAAAVDDYRASLDSLGRAGSECERAISRERSRRSLDGPTSTHERNQHRDPAAIGLVLGAVRRNEVALLEAD